MTRPARGQIWVILDRHSWFPFPVLGESPDDDYAARQAVLQACARLDLGHPDDAPHLCVMLDTRTTTEDLHQIARRNPPKTKVSTADAASHASCPPGTILQTGERVDACIFRVYSEYPLT